MIKAWKIYFYLMIVVMALEYSFRGLIQICFVSTRYFLTNHLIDLLLIVLSLFGLYGYVYGKRITSYQKIWGVFFALLLSYDFWSSYSEFVNLQSESEPIIFKIIFDFLISIPLYIALFLYGFRCHNIWVKPVAICRNQNK